MIEKYNMQSGLIRNSFKAHTKEITAILSDNVNMTFVSSSLDSSIKVINIDSFGTSAIVR